MTIELATVANFLEHCAPASLAAEWDNVGLLVGRRNQSVGRIMTCLTVTPDVAAEAIETKVDLIVSHHPLPFRSIKRLTNESTTGTILLDLIASGVAIYSPHTAFDSARDGINQSLARGLRMRGIAPLVSEDPTGTLGSGRWGWFDEEFSFGQLMERTKKFLKIDRLHWVGDPNQTVRTLGIACGAADEFLDIARRLGCDAMIIGETRYHTCLEAEAAGMGLIMPGHYASERFAVESLAQMLTQRFPELSIQPSHREHDPIHWG